MTFGDWLAARMRAGTSVLLEPQPVGHVLLVMRDRFSYQEIALSFQALQDPMALDAFVWGPVEELRNLVGIG